jgi:hypothetical protein
MTDIIKKLTPEQEAKFPEYREKWLAIGLNTDPIDRKAAIKAVKFMYECAELDHPKHFLFATSPKDATRIIEEESKGKITGTSTLESTVFGAHDAAWLSFYDFFLNEVGIKDIDAIRGLIEVAKHCGWVNTYDTHAIIQNRPSLIKMDEDNRLHSETGPVILYEDGFSVYAWHGTRIPGEWIEDGITAAEALRVENIEQRRAACELLGWAGILHQLNAVTIDENPDPQIGVLVEVELPDFEDKERFLRVMCGTEREFAIPVPPTMKTALEANAWTYGMDAEDYQPEIRT